MGVRMFGTSVVVESFHVSDGCWRAAYGWAFVERLGLNNSHRIAHMCTPQQLTRFTYGAHLENWWGLPSDIRKVPDFQGYYDRAVRETEIHFGETLFDTPWRADPRTGETILMSEVFADQPEKWQECHRRAIELVDRAVEEAASGWYNTVTALVPQFGDRWMEVFGSPNPA